MNKILIEGGNQLNGVLKISGSKNSALPIIAATLLTDNDVFISNIPNVTDVTNMLELVSCYGKIYSLEGQKVILSDSNLKANECIANLLYKKIRASCLILGPMLARGKSLQIKMPGGCAIGKRPIDMHLNALQKMGAEFSVSKDTIYAKARFLIGAEITFAKTSVGATQNLMMAATLAKGKTVIKNAATEPEVTDLARFLIKMGAQINGIGKKELEIKGVDSLGSCDHKVIPDRIEAGTYLIMLAATGGSLKISGIKPEHMQSVVDKISETNCLKMQIDEDSITAHKINDVAATNIETNCYPGFPTDLQPQFTSLMCIANGKSTIKENIFENRFMHISELKKMCSKIKVINANKIEVTGVRKLFGANLDANDLRGGAALLIAAACANGSSVINKALFIDRGYQDICKKLFECGISITHYQSEKVLYNETFQECIAASF